MVTFSAIIALFSVFIFYDKVQRDKIKFFQVGMKYLTLYKELQLIIKKKSNSQLQNMIEVLKSLYKNPSVSLIQRLKRTAKT